MGAKVDSSRAIPHASRVILNARALYKYVLLLYIIYLGIFRNCDMHIYHRIYIIHAAPRCVRTSGIRNAKLLRALENTLKQHERP